MPTLGQLRDALKPDGTKDIVILRTSPFLTRTEEEIAGRR